MDEGAAPADAVFHIVLLPIRVGIECLEPASSNTVSFLHNSMINEV